MDRESICAQLVDELGTPDGVQLVLAVQKSLVVPVKVCTVWPDTIGVPTKDKTAAIPQPSQTALAENIFIVASPWVILLIIFPFDFTGGNLGPRHSPPGSSADPP